ncbi:hypothetical protein SH661x_002883 [Planctomicrobium sp. SH661]|uniref:hypothetical protein n=1 Tax=Planctomicrobium sp. SH661 TaxID=3448124 RepID=UPI003F5B7EE5
MSTVILDRHNQHLYIHPYVPELEHLRTTGFGMENDDTYGSVITRHAVRLVHPDPENAGGGITGPGLEPLIEEFLWEQGYEVKRTHSPPGRLPRPQSGIADEDQDSTDRRMLGFISKHERGIIRYFDERMRPSPVSPVQLLRQIILAWPRLRILILCTGQETAHQLGRILPAAEVIRPHTSMARCPRVVVCPYSAAACGCVDAKTIDICIVFQPTECFSLRPTFSSHPLSLGQAVVPLRNLWLAQLGEQTRLFGLLPASYPLTIQQRDILLMLFGEKVLTIPRHGMLQRQIEVMSFEHQHPSCSRSRDVLETKRHCIWKCKSRNGRIAKLAQAISDGSIHQLRDLGPEIQSVQWTRAGLRVGILADSVEHAYALSLKLPQASVSLHSSVNDVSLSEKQVQWITDIQERSPSDSQIVIATRGGLGRIERRDVLIDATGSPGPPAIPDRLLETRSVRDPLLLIDIDDQGNDLLESWSRRRQAYHSRQAVDSTSPAEALKLVMEAE